MQVDDVGFGKFGCPGDVFAGIGDRYFKQVAPAEEVGCPYHEAFPYKMAHDTQQWSAAGHVEGVGLFLAYQHLGLHTVVD